MDRITIMTETRALQRLLAWLSPAFPVGAFAYSGGLETAISDGRVRNPAALREWMEGNHNHASAATDAVLLAAAHFNFDDHGKLGHLADLCLALTPSGQRYRELNLIGDAFVQAASAWPSDILARLPTPCPYPVAVGAIAAANGIAVHDTLIAFLSAYCQSQISVAVRLVPLGQTDGLKVLAGLEPLIAGCATTATNTSLDDIGAIGYATDIAAMSHETLGSRIFRS
jgi:urease accessory protein